MKNYIMNNKIKSLSIFIVLSIIISILFLNYQSTPYYADLDLESQEYIKNISFKITSNSNSDIDKIITLNNWINQEIEHKGYDDISEFEVSHDPKSVISRGWGLCFDRSYMLELMAQSLGFKVRHIAMASNNGDSSHAVSEVYINDKWVLVDSTYNKIYYDENKAPMSLKQVHKKRFKLLEYEPETMDSVIYGVNSFHGKFFEPKIPFPDINLNQVLYNYEIIHLLPYKFKNIHRYLIAILIIIVSILVYTYKKPFKKDNKRRYFKKH